LVGSGETLPRTALGVAFLVSAMFLGVRLLRSITAAESG
jgi:hypothetical protein